MKLAPDVVSVQTKGGAVVLNERTGRYFQLNAAGAMILEALLRGEPAHDVVDEVAKRYRVTTRKVAADLTLFVESMAEKGLVECA